MKILSLLVAGVLLCCSTATAENKVICYFASWATYRPGEGKFDVEDIDVDLCTHVIYTFAGLDGTTHTIYSLDPWNDLTDNYGKGGYSRFVNLKQKKPELKVLLAIGGWNEGSVTYSDMARNSANRATFIESVVAFLKEYGFDGLDFDWEYPGQRGGRIEDKENYAALLKELRAAFDPEGLILTAAVPALKSYVDTGYDIPALVENLDFINVMTYDYHGAWESVTGLNSPLYVETEDQLNVDYTMSFYEQSGVPAEQLLVGLPAYGRSYTLVNESDNGIRAPASGVGTAGPYTQEGGMLGYNEIEQSMADNPDAWTVVRDEKSQSPYAYRGDQWVTYEDPTSAQVRAQYVLDKGYGGIVVWSIETDDFKGYGGQTFALLQSVNDVFQGKKH